MRPRLTRPGALRALVTPLVATAAVTVLTGLSSPALAAGGEAPTPAHARPWFGPDLNWQTDTSQAYSRRLGVDPSLVGRTVGYPLSADGVSAVRDLVQRSSTAGAVAVLTLQPGQLRDLTTTDAEQLVHVLHTVSATHPSYVLLRFGPEMNGSWTPWGRRPGAYKAAFKQLATVVHGSDVAAAMVWTPAYGAGYPFTKALNATTSNGDGTTAPRADGRTFKVLDTNHDGVLDDRDDPYGPYYPGDAAVDWVGLSMLRYGASPSFGANTVPAPDELESRFRETFGYGDDLHRATFYVRFAGKPHQPFLLVTGAMYNPARPDGAAQSAVKDEWLHQVLQAARTRLMLRGVEWLEQERQEPEVGNDVNWRLSSPASLVTGVRSQLRDRVTLAPVDLPATSSGSTGPADAGTTTRKPRPSSGSTTGSGDTKDASTTIGASNRSWFGSFAAGSLSTLLVVLVAMFAVWRVRRRRMIPPWLR